MKLHVKLSFEFVQCFTNHSSARNVFFSFLIISQVGYIHSNHVVSETLSDSSARNVFFSFLIILQVGYIFKTVI